MTAAGGHASVLLAEAVSALAINDKGCYVDATFGRGGHSREILARLGPKGRLIAFDRDPAAVAAAQVIEDPRFQICHTAFSGLGQALTAQAVEQVDGILLDLGVSSPQLDTPERGMSFRFDAPLDMRMDTTQGETAADFLSQADQHEIERVVRDYGEERFAHAIAKAVVVARCERGISNTRQLAAIVEKAVRTREPGQHPATRCFQALRIHVNRELEELALVLPLCIEKLAVGGRLVVISFHSLEDRIVKRFMRDAASPLEPPKSVPVRAHELPSPPMRLVGKAVRASAAEVAANPRSRSAVMRVAEKIGPLAASCQHKSAPAPKHRRAGEVRLGKGA